MQALFRELTINLLRDLEYNYEKYVNAPRMSVDRPAPFSPNLGNSA